jgi:hypothetical protein
MMQLDKQRHAQLPGYTATRHYLAVNKHRRAEMLVRSPAPVMESSGSPLFPKMDPTTSANTCFTRC